MAFVYRYTDLKDNIVKYIGIVWQKDRTLEERIAEHNRLDEWCTKSQYRVDYFQCDNRMEAELYEAYYIGKYETGKYYNIRKRTWGKSTLLNLQEDQWKKFTIVNEEKEIEKYDNVSLHWILSEKQNKIVIGELRLKNCETKTGIFIDFRDVTMNYIKNQYLYQYIFSQDIFTNLIIKIYESQQGGKKCILLRNYILGLSYKLDMNITVTKYKCNIEQLSFGNISVNVKTKVDEKEKDVYVMDNFEILHRIIRSENPRPATIFWSNFEKHVNRVLTCIEKEK